MIEFERFQLANGLKLIVHQDKSTPLASVCLTYNVGTKHEQPDKTGFAHLFEHLMFGGSKHAANFDDYIQQAGGENNAFTNQDMTVFYEYLPCENIETALWLEADRMLHLNLGEQELEKERKVVVEEFKESCLNEPYGDIWHHIGPLAYKKHPYSIPTIGMEIAHIEQATTEDVALFFEQHYSPNNAVLSVCGNVNPQEVFELVEKWFAGIPKGTYSKPSLPQEDEQVEQRRLVIEADVPLNAIYMVFHSAPRDSQDFYVDDFISDVLAEGDAAQLYQKLVKELELFSEIDAYITASIDQGLFIVEGRLADGVSFEEAETAIWKELERTKTEQLPPQKVERMHNQIEHNIEFGKLNNLNKAIRLGYYEVLDDAHRINEEQTYYSKIDAEGFKSRCKDLFSEQKSSVIYYKSNR